ncbi:hypothetical protein DUNSADRAFT_8908 [Dunaliella salina]|uniref:Uncharacterized protein n=1 Tax=Dunaliella salina TaxID=3046 RepID=A0ABQ7GIL0_DUNSA|nr:hypothetical protein DUNSADRAFT_8908 [Dunaliella salina]|eukprot:KAF5834445.1 hypothetical protein DUNSADRAFT_8908 [Dunaliella salina]
MVQYVMDQVGQDAMPPAAAAPTTQTTHTLNAQGASSPAAEAP